jgi:hypothetical protein
MEKSKTLSIPESLLGLEDVEVIESFLTFENEIITRVKSTKKEIKCHRCGALCDAHGSVLKCDCAIFLFSVTERILK